MATLSDLGKSLLQAGLVYGIVPNPGGRNRKIIEELLNFSGKNLDEYLILPESIATMLRTLLDNVLSHKKRNDILAKKIISESHAEKPLLVANSLKLLENDVIRKLYNHIIKKHFLLGKDISSYAYNLPPMLTTSELFALAMILFENEEKIGLFRHLETELRIADKVWKFPAHIRENKRIRREWLIDLYLWDMVRDRRTPRGDYAVKVAKDVDNLRDFLLRTYLSMPFVNIIKNIAYFIALDIILTSYLCYNRTRAIEYVKDVCNFIGNFLEIEINADSIVEEMEISYLIPKQSDILDPAASHIITYTSRVSPHVLVMLRQGFKESIL